MTKAAPTASQIIAYGEPVRRVRNKAGTVSELWWGAVKLLPENKVIAEMTRRYAAKPRPAVRRRRAA